MKSNKILIILLISAAVLIIFLVAGKKAGWFGKKDQLKVAVEKPEKRKIIETITANGKIQPETEVKVAPDVSGEIVELNVKEGDDVVKGQLLVKIKPENYISQRDRAEASLNSFKANLSQVQAQFTKAEQDYNRSKTLWEQKTISKSEFEQAEAAYSIAKANVEAAKFNVQSAAAGLKDAQESLVKTSIYSPMTGTISKLDVKLGERVAGTGFMMGTEMMRVADLGRMEVQVDVNENDIVKVSLKDTALIEVDAYLNRKFKGIVTEIANSASTTGISADQVTNFQVKIRILKDSYEDFLKKGIVPFRPGMSATVDIQTDVKYDALSIPIQAVTARTDSVLYEKDTIKKKNFTGKNIEIVFIADAGKAKIVEVKTGIQDNNNIEILTGLTGNEQVITAPFTAISKKLKPDDLILITDKKKLFTK